MSLLQNASSGIDGIIILTQITASHSKVVTRLGLEKGAVIFAAYIVSLMLTFTGDIR